MKPQSLVARLAAVSASLLAGVAPAWSEGAETPKAAEPPKDSIAAALGPAGDPGGLRSALAARGVEYGLTYIGEAWRIERGGFKRGATGNGRLEGFLDIDFGKLGGWTGLSFHANAFNIYGTGPSTGFVGNIFAISNIEALPTTRLSELWLEQSFFDGVVRVRAGQLAADTQFLSSDLAGIFINGTFGWPGIAAANLPSGGPAYPLATPGVGLGIKVNDQLSFRFAVVNGDPAGPGFGNPQARDRHGVNFRVNDGALFNGVLAYSWGASALPGTVKLGGWYHTDRFADQRFATDGLLADPSASGQAIQRRGNYGTYAIFDQAVYRVPDGGDRGVGVFTRVMASPADRNLIDFYVDGGIAFKGIADSRPDDSFGVALAFARISPSASAFDRDVDVFGSSNNPIRDFELVFEATYQAQLAPGWTLQPDIQYIVHPGGRVIDPRDPAGTAPIKNALVFGLRTTIKY